MADGTQTAATAIKTITPMLGMIPGIGQVASVAGGIIGGVLENDVANNQAAQAEKMRKEALRTQTQALRPEFAQAERIRKMQALQGLQGKEQIAENIDENIAANLRSIKESSPQGATATAAISALVNKANAQKRELGIKDAQIKYDATGKLADTKWDMGLQQRGLEDRRDLQRTQGLTAASAMENAATANKMNATNKIIGSVTSTATALTKNAGGNNNNDGGFSDWYNSYLASQQQTTGGNGYYAPANSDYNPLLTPTTAAATAPLNINNNPYNQYVTPTTGFWQ